MNGLGAHERSEGSRRRWRWGLVAGVIFVVAGVGAYALARTGSEAVSHETQSVVARRRLAPAPVTLAPNGMFTTASGTTTAIAALRGTPTVVWFVAGGCATCAASIPAVAAHFDKLTHYGLRVLTLGLYGDFAPGEKGVGELLSFGRAAAGADIERPGWEWGLASKSLSLAYDPTGIPALYVLIGATGVIRYRNSVPVSTMRNLLAAAKRLGSRADASPGSARRETGVESVR